jgi:hypothetical protein
LEWGKKTRKQIGYNKNNRVLSALLYLTLPRHLAFFSLSSRVLIADVVQSSYEKLEKIIKQCEKTIQGGIKKEQKYRSMV